MNIVNLYKTNAKFHSFVVAMAFTLVSAAHAYTDGVPSNKVALHATLSFFGGALWGGLTRWLTTNVPDPGK